jgi:hypothetical protein
MQNAYLQSKRVPLPVTSDIWGMSGIGNAIRQGVSMIEERTGVAGVVIQYCRNHEGKWTAFPRMPLNEMADGLKGDECMLLADALRRAASRIADLNSSDKSDMLFEG